jgi:hypothetical protein
LLHQEGIEPVLFWYNPNIHPLLEHRQRKEALVEYAGRHALQLIDEGQYGLRDFVKAVCPDFDTRCAYCYTDRLEYTVRYASENGYDAFTTTLLISPYQNHDLIVKTASRLAEQYKLLFLYRDFRPAFRESQQKARQEQLYMQKYCGCIFSEEERYRSVK